MDKNKSLIEKMTAFGIPEKNAMIYSALLTKSELTAVEIQKMTHIPRTKVYEITHKMAQDNMCIEKHIHGKTKYQAVEPKKFFHYMIQKHEQELTDKKILAEDIETLASPLYTHRTQNTDPSKSAEIIKDQASIHERYVDLLKTTNKEILGLIKPPYAHRNNELKLNEQDKILFQKIKKGLDARMLYEMPRTNIEGTYDYIKKCVKNGEKARVIDNVPVKMYIFDEKYIIVALTDVNRDASQLTMYSIEHPSLAQAGKMLFNHLWKHASDYKILAPRISRD
ncbi:MAG: helix-turn-helix domain-containing protein [bacterium]